MNKDQLKALLEVIFAPLEAYTRVHYGPYLTHFVHLLRVDAEDDGTLNLILQLIGTRRFAFAKATMTTEELAAFLDIVFTALETVTAGNFLLYGAIWTIHRIAKRPAVLAAILALFNQRGLAS